MAEVTVTTSMLIAIIAALVGLGIMIFGGKMKANSRKTWGWISGGAVLVMVLAIVFSAALPTQLGFLNNPLLNQQQTIGGTTITYAVAGGNNVGQPSTTSVCAYQPTGSYTTKDKFATTTISGTSYYKPNGQPATTTATSNLNKGIPYTYWVSNSSYYAKPITVTADCGVNNFISDSWDNGTSAPSLTGYDIVNRQSTSGGTYNTSFAGNARASEQFTYQGVAKKSLIPFGGVAVLEYNSTISSVTCTGAQLSPNSGKYHVTYTPASLAGTYQIFEVSSDLDDGSGAVRTIDCQFQNGATAAGAGSAYILTLIPANYYPTNAGDIKLDVEKFDNQDTARTGLGQISKTFYWGS